MTVAGVACADGSANAFPGAGRADAAPEGQKRDQVTSQVHLRPLASRPAGAEEIIDEQTVVICFQNRDYTEVSGRVLLHALGAGGMALCGQAAERLTPTGSDWDLAYLPHLPCCRGCVAATSPGGAGPAMPCFDVRAVDDDGREHQGLPADSWYGGAMNEASGGFLFLPPVGAGTRRLRGVVRTFWGAAWGGTELPVPVRAVGQGEVADG